MPSFEILIPGFPAWTVARRGEKYFEEANNTFENRDLNEYDELSMPQFAACTVDIFLIVLDMISLLSLFCFQISKFLLFKTGERSIVC